MSRYDFTRGDAPGYDMLYPETDEAFAWAEANIPSGNLSDDTAIIDAEQYREAIIDAGFTIEEAEGDD